MEVGTVDNIKRTKTKGGDLYILEIDGRKLSFFGDSDVELGDIEEGDKVRYSSEQNGEYINITELELVEKGEPSGASKGDELKKGAALKAAARVTDSPEETKDAAKEFYRLLKGDDWK